MPVTKSRLSSQSAHDMLKGIAALQSTRMKAPPRLWCLRLFGNENQAFGVALFDSQLTQRAWIAG